MTENARRDSQPWNEAVPGAGSSGSLGQAPYEPVASHGPVRAMPTRRPALPEVKASGRRKPAGIMAIILGALLLLPALVMLEDADLGLMASLLFLAALGNMTIGVLVLVKLGGQSNWAPVALMIAAASVVILGIIGPIFGLFNLALLMISLPLVVPIGILAGLELAKEKRRTSAPRFYHASGPVAWQPELGEQLQRAQAPDGSYVLDQDRTGQPQYLQHPTPPMPPHVYPPRKRPNSRGIGLAGKIVLAATTAAVLAIGGYLLLPSQNSDACKLYEAAVHDLDDAVAMSQEGVIGQSDVRAAFRELPKNIGSAADKAHGNVLVEMQKSFAYASAYQASPTEDNGMAYFMHQNRVAEVCSADRAPIDVD